MKRKTRPAKRSGRTPDLLRKSGPMRDRTKYQRNHKHRSNDNA